MLLAQFHLRLPLPRQLLEIVGPEKLHAITLNQSKGGGKHSSYTIFCELYRWGKTSGPAAKLHRYSAGHFQPGFRPDPSG